MPRLLPHIGMTECRGAANEDATVLGVADGRPAHGCRQYARSRTWPALAEVSIVD